MPDYLHVLLLSLSLPYSSCCQLQILCKHTSSRNLTAIFLYSQTVSLCMVNWYCSAVAARGQGAPGQMTWLKGFRPGFRPGCHFFLLIEIYVCRRGTHKERRSFCQFADSKNVKSITSLDPCHSFITVSVTKIVIRLLTDVIWHCMFALTSHGTAFGAVFYF